MGIKHFIGCLLLLILCACSDSDEVITISTAEELAAIGVSKPLNGHYVLDADISLAGYADWQPIGTKEEPFTGKFNGNGYKISDMKIRSIDSDRAYDYSADDLNKYHQYAVGLFGVLMDAYVTNVALENISIDPDISFNESWVPKHRYLIDVGGIAGMAVGEEGSTISNSYSTGSIKVDGDYITAQVGGLVGYIGNSNINQSYSSVSVQTSIQTSDADSGGIAGNGNKSAIVNSYSTGDISSAGRAGGILGNAYQINIAYSYSTGDINSFRSGGIVGAIVENTNDPSDFEGECEKVYFGGEYWWICPPERPAKSIIQGCAAMNSSVTSSNVGNEFGRIVSNYGTDDYDILKNNIASIELAPFDAEGSSTIDGGTLSANEFTKQATYEAIGWKFGNTNHEPWVMRKDSIYPVLYWQ